MAFPQSPPRRPGDQIHGPQTESTKMRNGQLIVDARDDPGPRPAGDTADTTIDHAHATADMATEHACR
jgi:hypothetical protein